MKIYNFTGRDINIYSQEDTVTRGNRLYLRSVFLSPREIIKPSCAPDQTPKVFSTTDKTDLDYLRDIPVQQFLDAEPIADFCPEFDPKYDLLIAPNIWTQVVRTLNLEPSYARFANVFGLIYNPSNDKPIGCLGLEFK